jgi:hypothetical protein
MIEFFISLCEELLRIRNYQLCIAISMALHSPHIRRFDVKCIFASANPFDTHRPFRLQQTWAIVDPKFAAKNTEIQNFFSHSKNFSEYRKIMNTLEGPAAGESESLRKYIHIISIVIHSHS